MAGAAHRRRCAALTAALAGGELDGAERHSAVLMDLDALDAAAAHVQRGAGFPSSALHTVAVKANPIGGVLAALRDAGLGAEAASLGELQQALRVGFAPDRIVFDSPAKTLGELRFALASGVAVNLDNWQELQRAAALLAAEPGLLRPGQHVGLRINPQVGEGSIAALSTGGAVSKFGFPLQECRAELVAAFAEHPWLDMLHLHVGSQGVPLEVTVAGVEAVWGLLLEVEAATAPGRVALLDIGGGLSVDFASDDPPEESAFAAQARLLRAALPALFAPGCRTRIVTENGRSLLAKAGCIVSRVEYTKSSGGRHIAVCHVGADLCMRACYLPSTYGLRVFLCDAAGAPREGAPGAEAVVQDVAGPLCFQGDRLAVGATMPRASPGDWVVVADAGAYTLAMFSRYNSRCSPPVYGYRGAAPGEDAGGGGVALTLLRAGETLEQGRGGAARSALQRGAWRRGAARRAAAGRTAGAVCKLDPAAFAIWGVCEAWQRPHAAALAAAVAGAEAGTFSPCDLHAALGDRTLWLIGDSHVKGLYASLRCFAFDLWDQAVGECDASADAGLQKQLELVTAQARRAAAAAGGHPYNTPPSCLHMRGSRGRICLVHSPIGDYHVSADSQSPGTLQLLHANFTTPEDAVYVSIGRWHANNCEGTHPSYAASLEKIGAYAQANAGSFPPLVFGVAPHDHTKCTGGALDFDVPACLPASQGGYDLATGLELPRLAHAVLGRYGVPVVDSYNLSMSLHDGHITREQSILGGIDCLHFCRPSLAEARARARAERSAAERGAPAAAVACPRGRRPHSPRPPPLSPQIDIWKLTQELRTLNAQQGVGGAGAGADGAAPRVCVPRASVLPKPFGPIGRGAVRGEMLAADAWGSPLFE
ncbi:lysA [Scenedesmus sp. PABB004]|nr:lysA [Scenedesmus sp. PABB004]